MNFLTSEISTTTAQFIFRKIWPIKIRTSAAVTDESKIYNAPNINGVEINNPTPQMTGSIQAIFFLSQKLNPLPKIKPVIPAALSIAPNINPTLKYLFG